MAKAGVHGINHLDMALQSFSDDEGSEENNDLKDLILDVDDRKNTDDKSNKLSEKSHKRNAAETILLKQQTFADSSSKSGDTKIVIPGVSAALYEGLKAMLIDLLKSFSLMNATIGILVSLALEGVGVEGKLRSPRYNVAILLILVVAENFPSFPVNSIRPQFLIFFLTLLSIIYDGFYLKKYYSPAESSFGESMKIVRVLLAYVIAAKSLALISFLRHATGMEKIRKYLIRRVRVFGIPYAVHRRIMREVRSRVMALGWLHAFAVVMYTVLFIVSFEYFGYVGFFIGTKYGMSMTGFLLLKIITSALVSVGVAVDCDFILCLAHFGCFGCAMDYVKEYTRKKEIEFGGWPYPFAFNYTRFQVLSLVKFIDFAIGVFGWLNITIIFEPEFLSKNDGVKSFVSIIFVTLTLTDIWCPILFVCVFWLLYVYDDTVQRGDLSDSDDSELDENGVRDEAYEKFSKSEKRRKLELKKKIGKKTLIFNGKKKIFETLDSSENNSEHSSDTDARCTVRSRLINNAGGNGEEEFNHDDEYHNENDNENDREHNQDYHDNHMSRDSCQNDNRRGYQDREEEEEEEESIYFGVPNQIMDRRFSSGQRRGSGNVSFQPSNIRTQTRSRTSSWVGSEDSQNQNQNQSQNQNQRQGNDRYKKGNMNDRNFGDKNNYYHGYGNDDFNNNSNMNQDDNRNRNRRQDVIKFTDNYDNNNGNIYQKNNGHSRRNSQEVLEGGWQVEEDGWRVIGENEKSNNQPPGEYDEEQGYCPKGHESNKEMIRKHRMEAENKQKEEQAKNMKKVLREEESEELEDDFYGGGRDKRWNGVFEKEVVLRKDKEEVKKESGIIKAAKRIFHRRGISKSRNQNDNSSDSDDSNVEIRNADSPSKNGRAREKRKSPVDKRRGGSVTEKADVVLSPLIVTRSNSNTHSNSPRSNSYSNSPHSNSPRSNSYSNSPHSNSPHSNSPHSNSPHSSSQRSNSYSNSPHSNTNSQNTYSKSNSNSPHKSNGNNTVPQFSHDWSTTAHDVPIDQFASTRKIASRSGEKSKDAGEEHVSENGSGRGLTDKLSPGRIFSKPLAFAEKNPNPPVATLSHENTYAASNDKIYETIQNPYLRKYSIGSLPSPASVSAIPSPRPKMVTSPGKLDPGRIGRFNNNNGSTDVRTESTKD